MVVDVILYTNEGCGLCEEVKAALADLQATTPHRLTEIPISRDKKLEKQLFDKIPVVEINHKRLEAPISRDQLKLALDEAQQRMERLAKRREKNENNSMAIRLNKWTLGFARNWAAFISGMILIYAGLPWVAPAAMHYGYPKVGEAIYTIYSPMCHQWAFRSWFLFGEEAAYPRERAISPNFDTSFEQVAADEVYFNGVDLAVLDNDLIFTAKSFRGSEQMGYKTALCERDVAIYGAMALFGFVFLFLSKAGIKVPYLPFWAYILIAIGPIGLDGFSQLFANPPFDGFGISFYPIRESTPFLRTLTGALFGIGNGWLAYPYIEESMEETAELIEKKLVKAGHMKRRKKKS